MAQNRTNMVSLFNIGKWLGGLSDEWVEMGDGFNELTEDWSPDFKETQYVNQKNKSSSLNGYAFSMSPEREFLSDAMQDAINSALNSFPVGTEAETFYARFFKTDVTSGSVKGIKLPIVCAPASVGGSAGDPLTTSIEIHGNGDAVEATITIGSDGTYTVA